MQISELNDTLLKYRGGKARLWDFSPTHDRIVIELSKAIEERRVYLVLLGCTHVHLSTLFRIENPTVSADSSGFVFVDNGVRVAFALEFQLNHEYQP